MAKRSAKPRASKSSHPPEAPAAAAPIDVSGSAEGPPPVVEAPDGLSAGQLAERERDATLRTALDQLEVQRFELDAASLSLGQRETALTDATRALQGRESSLVSARATLVARERALAESAGAMAEREQRAENTERALRARYEAMVEREKSVAEREAAMAQREGAITAREAALTPREAALAVRERAVIESERDLTKVRERERDLTARARALDARDEELAIREAAADEAMSLASESMEHPRPRLAEDELLEGPDMPAPVISAAQAQLAAMQQAEERRRQEAERVAAEDRKRLHEEAAQLLGLTRTIPALEMLGPRIQKALDSLNYTVLVAFYNMAVRQVAEYAKSAPGGERVESLETAAAERQKALDDATALISSLKEDFSRYRTRVENEREVFAVRANEELLRRILPVADNFDRALVAAGGASNVDAVLSGVRMIQRQIEDVMAQAGLVPIKAVGLAFDPRVHEAIARVESSGVPEDTVLEEVQRGYYLGSKVFRPSMVKVSCSVVGASSASAASEG